MKINLIKKKLDLKVNWKLSRNETLFKENFFIHILDGNNEFLGEIAPNIRYGETSDVIIENFNRVKDLKLNLTLLESIWKEGEFCHSFKFGLESAMVHFEAFKQGKTVASFLGLQSEIKSIPTSFSVPIMEESELGEYLSNISRFPFIKIKVSQDNAISFVKNIAKYTQAPLRVDGNEGWTDFDSYKRFEKECSKLNIQFIEQPFKSVNKDFYLELQKDSHFEIMADESIEDSADFQEISKMFNSVNIKLMKTGGYLNAIKLLEEAKRHNLKTMIGCMIETSVGISSAINISSLGDYFDLDGSLLLKNDPYNFITESNGYLSKKS